MGQEVNICENSWTKFPLNKRQPSKALKFSRQPSKSEKINHQPSKLPPCGETYPPLRERELES